MKNLPIRELFLDPDRASYLTPEQCVAHASICLSQEDKPKNFSHLCTSGGRSYFFGPDFETLMCQLMGFVLSQAGVYTPRTIEGLYQPELIRGVLYYPLSTVHLNYTFESYGFFPGCDRFRGDLISLRTHYQKSPFQYLIITPHDLEKEFISLHWYATQGVRLISSFEPLSSDLRMIWNATGATPVADYCIAWDSGLCFYTCASHHQHWLPSTCALHDKDGNLLTPRPGLRASRFSSLMNQAQRFIAWASGDTLHLLDEVCSCGRPWLCKLESRRDAYLLWGESELTVEELEIDPLPGIQIFQDVKQQVSLRYDDHELASKHLDALEWMMQKLSERFKCVTIEEGRIHHGEKIPSVYSLATREKMFMEL